MDSTLADLLHVGQGQHQDRLTLLAEAFSVFNSLTLKIMVKFKYSPHTGLDHVQLHSSRSAANIADREWVVIHDPSGTGGVDWRSEVCLMQSAWVKLEKRLSNKL